MKAVTRKSLHLMVLAAACATVSAAARAVEATVDLGVPTVASQQGQRLKVIVPVTAMPGDRATAASFLVRETEVPRGQRALAAQDFTVMRPATADYVVFQSGELVYSPAVSLIVSVAGDPRSPYRMDLQVPPASAGDRMAVTDLGSTTREGTRDRFKTRKLRGPVGDADLPPK